MDSRQKRKQECRRRRVVEGTVILVIFLVAVLAMRRWLPADRNDLFRGGEEPVELTDQIVPGQIPMFYQFDERWKDQVYGDGTMELTGCGPTCLSMVLCGLTQSAKYGPAQVAGLADRWGYYAEGAGSLWTLMTEGAERFGLRAEEVIFDRKHIEQELRAGRPIICVMGPGDFTTTGHFIVLCSLDAEGQVTVHDPNSRERSERGWELDELMPQIKNLWSYEKST